MQIKRTFTAALLAATCTFTVSGPATAASYPDQPIHMVVPVGAGGLTDTLARLIGAGISDKLGQPVVVENKPGAGGIIGMEAAAKFKPDGYGLVLVYQGVAAVNASLYKDLPYDTLRDFTPIAGLGSFPMVLVTNPNKGIKSVADFVEQAKKDPENFAYGSAGNGTTSHLTMELFKKDTGIDVLHIPYKGESTANTDLAGGQVDIAFSSLASVIPLVNSGRLMALGIGTLERSDVFPDVPTIAESGYPEFEAVGWYGLLAPAGTPSEIVNLLSDTVRDVLSEQETRDKLATLGVTPKATSAEELGQQIENETIKWKEVIEKANITIN